MGLKPMVVWRKVRDYVRYDLKEIAFPSSLPDPPHIKKRRELTWHERFLVLKKASRLYAASWVRDIGPDLRPNDYKKVEENDAGNNVNKKEEPSTLEDLGLFLLVGFSDTREGKKIITIDLTAIAARGGMETLRPALQRIYMTRASAYRDALKSFIVGYQEGVQEVMGQKNSFESPLEEHDAEKTKK